MASASAKAAQSQNTSDAWGRQSGKRDGSQQSKAKSAKEAARIARVCLRVFIKRSLNS